MDDIVERLRTAVTYGYMPRQMREVADEAAAEISHLREALAARDERINELEMREEALWYEMKERD